MSAGALPVRFGAGERASSQPRKETSSPVFHKSAATPRAWLLCLSTIAACLNLTHNGYCLRHTKHGIAIFIGPGRKAAASRRTPKRSVMVPLGSPGAPCVTCFRRESRVHPRKPAQQAASHSPRLPMHRSGYTHDPRQTTSPYFHSCRPPSSSRSWPTLYRTKKSPLRL